MYRGGWLRRSHRHRRHLGRIIVSPNDATRDRYKERRLFRESLATQLQEIRDLPASTSDGVRIELMANLEFPNEAASCVARGAGKMVENIHNPIYRDILTATQRTRRIKY